MAKYKANKNAFTTVFAVFALATLAFVMVLNWQPWFNVSQVLVRQIDTGPVLGLLNWLFGSRAAKLLGIAFIVGGIARIKKNPAISGLLFLCAFIAWASPSTLVGALGEIVGFLLWGWIQFVQMSPMLASHSLIPASQKWMVELRRYRIAAYALEIMVCFYKYPPYAGGDLNKLLFDIQNFSISASSFSWANFFSAFAVIVCVEMVLGLLLKAALVCGVFQAERKNTSNHYAA